MNKGKIVTTIGAILLLVVVILCLLGFSLWSRVDEEK